MGYALSTKMATKVTPCSDKLNQYHHQPLIWLKVFDDIFLILGTKVSTVLPAKSDSGDMFCLQSYQELRIDRSLVYLFYPQDRSNTQVIYRFALAQVKCTR